MDKVKDPQEQAFETGLNKGYKEGYREGFKEGRVYQLEQDMKDFGLPEEE